MKHILKTKLFALLAISGATVYGALETANAQDGYGFVRVATHVEQSAPAKPAKEQAFEAPVVMTQADFQVAARPSAFPVRTEGTVSTSELPQQLKAARDLSGLQKSNASGKTAEFRSLSPLGPIPVPQTSPTVAPTSQTVETFLLPTLGPSSNPTAGIAILPPAQSNQASPKPISAMNLLAPIAITESNFTDDLETVELQAPLANESVEFAGTETEEVLGESAQLAVVESPEDAPSQVDQASAQQSISSQPMFIQEAPPVAAGLLPIPATSVPQFLNAQVSSAPEAPVISGRQMNARRPVESMPQTTPASIPAGLATITPVISTAPPKPVPLASTQRTSATAVSPQAVPMAPFQRTSIPAVQVPESVIEPGMVMAPNQGQPGDSYFATPSATTNVMPQRNAPCASCGGANGGCPDCGIVGGTNSSCQSCGPNGCYDFDNVASQFNSCGSVSMARRYIIAEALYFDRYDGNISNSNFGSLNDFEFNGGARFTIGRRADSTRGRELSYMGILPVEQTQQFTNAAGLITSRFIPGDGLGLAQTSSFFNVTDQSESKETYFHSLEFNRVKWGWDVMKTYLGLRYLMIDDSYTMYSQSLGGDQGKFQMDTTNNLFGPHIGCELYYDVGFRFSFSLSSKAGVYANFNQVETTLVNNGTEFLRNKDKNTAFAGSYELGLNTHYRLTKHSRARVGYNFLWLGEVASVSDNLTRFLTPSTGIDSSDSDDMLFHGVSFGFEMFR